MDGYHGRGSLPHCGANDHETERIPLFLYQWLITASAYCIKLASPCYTVYQPSTPPVSDFNPINLHPRYIHPTLSIQGKTPTG